MNRIVLSMLALGLLLTNHDSRAVTPKCDLPTPGGSQGRKEGETAPDDLWRIVAQSRVVVAGTLTAPAESIRASHSSKKYRSMTIRVTDCETAIKGSARRAIRFRWYTDPKQSSVSAERVLALDGKKALFFLTSTNGEFHFAGYTPNALADYDTKLVEHIRREVKAQRDVLRDFNKTYPPERVPLYAKVKSLIDATTRDNEAQAAAFRDLEALGFKGVPAIIALMDDRRKLANDRITLTIHDPDHWEGMHHWGVHTVVDAMAAILRQVTGEDFGSIYGDVASESERRAAVDGWRIYLVRGYEGWEKRMDSSTMPGPDGLIVSAVLRNEFIRLLGDAAAATRKKGGKVPPDWDKPAIQLPAIVEGYESIRDRELFRVAPALERRFTEGKTDGATAASCAGSYRDAIKNRRIEVPWYFPYVFEQLDAGKLQGTRLELVDRLLRARTYWPSDEDLKRFHSAKGKTKEEVRRLLGNPEDIEKKSGGERWRYPWMATAFVEFTGDRATSTFYDIGHH